MASGVKRIRAVVLANLRASPTKSAILGVVAVVLVVLLARQLWGGPQTATAVENLTNAWNALTAEETADSLESKRRERRPRPPLQGSVARNPFACAWLETDTDDEMGDAEETPLASSDSELVLQCTMRDADGRSRLAVISGVVVYPGSQMGRYKVKRIGARHVVLASGADELILKMP